MRLVGKLKQAARARARRNAESEVWNPTAGALFHGGRAGLAVGSLILPRSELNGRYLADRQLAEVGADYLEHHAESVFITDDASLALAYAGRRPRAAVYEVAPDEPLERDEDAPAGVGSWRCRRARVLRQLHVPFKVRQQLDIRLRSRIAGDGYNFEQTWLWLTATLE